MAAGGSQVPATGDIGHWNAVVSGVRRCLIPETLMCQMDWVLKNENMNYGEINRNAEEEGKMM